MRFCKDCVHYSVDVTERSVTERCMYGVTTGQNIVNGHEYYIQEPRNPHHTRHQMGADARGCCGRDAKHYKRIWWKFWASK